MSFTVSASANTGSAFLVPQGTHLATCFGVVGVGRQDTSYGLKDRVYFGWEIHGHRFQWTKDGVENNEPATIWRPYNISMHSNATMRIDIEAWLGRTLKPEEAKGFDLFQMVGKSCQLTTDHNTYGDRTYANVKNVSPVLDGVEVPAMEMVAVRYLKPTHIGDWTLLPKFLKDAVERGVESPPPPTAAVEDFHNDDINF